METAPYFPPPPSYNPRAATTPLRVLRGKFKRASDPQSTNSTGFPSFENDSKVDTEAESNAPNLPFLRRHSTWRLLPSSKFWTLVDNWWLWELISWGFAAFCMGAIAVLLAVYDQSAIPTWPWGLTINAYVSILGVFAKAALLLPTAEALGQLRFNWFSHQSRDILDFQVFDQASRGPWGSLLLILRTRGRALAAVGAAIVLLSTALDPFFQQIVLFPSRIVPVGNGTISRSRFYTSGMYDPQYTQDGLPTSFSDREMYYFVNPLLYYDVIPKAPNIPLHCPTGDCNWEPYDTLAVCNSCNDISHLLSFHCQLSQNEWLNSVSEGALSAYPKGKACGYFLNGTSDDPALMAGYGLSNNNNETLIGRLLPLSFPSNNRDSLYGGSITFRDIPAPLLDAIYVFTPGGFDAVRQNVTPVAMECNLRWCVQTLESNVQNGTLAETVLASVENTTAQPYPWNVNWTIMDYHYTALQSIGPPLVDLTFGVTTNTTTFTLILGFFESMRSYFVAETAISTPTMRYTSTGSNETVFIPANSTFWWNPAGITDHFDRIAKTMTSMARTCKNGTENITGVALGPQTYVSIRWQWFTLPLLLLVATLVFLVAVMLQSRANGLEVWKTSALAVLLHGLREHTGTGFPTQKNEAVNKLRFFNNRTPEKGLFLVRLRGRNGRWRFSKRLSR